MAVKAPERIFALAHLRRSARSPASCKVDKLGEPINRLCRMSRCLAISTGASEAEPARRTSRCTAESTGAGLPGAGTAS
eukprot:9467375-Pyramimonas_sp.AAC.1